MTSSGLPQGVHRDPCQRPPQDLVRKLVLYIQTPDQSQSGRSSYVYTEMISYNVHSVRRSPPGRRRLRLPTKQEISKNIDFLFLLMILHWTKEPPTGPCTLTGTVRTLQSKAYLGRNVSGERAEWNL